jgi:hypothetical protein
VASLLGNLGYERKALGTGISVHESSSTGDFERWMTGFWRWGSSVYGNSVKGTWREGSVVSDDGG